MKDGGGVPALGYLAIIAGIPTEALEDPEFYAATYTPETARDFVARSLATRSLWEEANKAHVRPGGPRIPDEWAAWLADHLPAVNLEARLIVGTYVKAGIEEPPE